MRHVCILSCAAVLISGGAAFADDVLYDSAGFESTNLGPLNGQGGWTAYAVGAPEPLVVTSPDPAIGQRAVRFEVPLDAGSDGYALIGIPDPLAQGYTRITVSFDTYRHPTTTLLQDYWFGWSGGAGFPWIGLQYDWDYDASNPGITRPLYDQGYDFVVRDTWANVTIQWDVEAATVSSWYNGVQLDYSVPFSNPLSSLTTYYFNFSSAYYGAEADVAWLDNLIITGYPELGGCDACDTNCDGSVNGFDIQPFVEILSGGGSPCSPCAADTNDDGSINGFDIQAFVECLGG